MIIQQVLLSLSICVSVPSSTMGLGNGSIAIPLNNETNTITAVNIHATITHKKNIVMHVFVPKTCILVKAKQTKSP